jgi:hypothetical protein
MACMLSRLTAVARVGVVLLMLPVVGIRAADAQTPLPGAQQPVQRSSRQFEVRSDVLAASHLIATQVGVGLASPFSTYLRMGIVLGAGVARSDGSNGFSARADLVWRLNPDPLRQVRWTPYLTVGASVRRDVPRATNCYLLALAGVEGPEWHGMLPALDLGLGGGVRLGVVLRHARPNRR